MRSVDSLPNAYTTNAISLLFILESTKPSIARTYRKNRTTKLLYSMMERILGTFRLKLSADFPAAGEYLKAYR